MSGRCRWNGKIEREQERGENPQAGKLAGKLNLPIFKTNLVVLVALLLVIAIVLLAADLFGHHR